MASVVKERHLAGFASGALAQIVVADKQLCELAVWVVSLLDIVDAGIGVNLNTR